MTYLAVSALSHIGAVRDHHEDSLVAKLIQAGATGKGRHDASPPEPGSACRARTKTVLMSSAVSVCQ